MLQPLYKKNIIIRLSIISQHKDNVGSWNNSLWKTNNMVADVLATQGARASVTMVLV